MYGIKNPEEAHKLLRSSTYTLPATATTSESTSSCVNLERESNEGEMTHNPFHDTIAFAPNEVCVDLNACDSK